VDPNTAMSLRMTELTKIPMGDSTMQDAAAVEHFPKILQKMDGEMGFIETVKGNIPKYHIDHNNHGVREMHSHQTRQELTWV